MNQNKNFNDNSENRVVKDTPGRSLAKAVTWRILASGATFLIAFVIFRRYTEQSMKEVFESATFVTILEFLSKILFYYIHERLWTNINWGKYMKRKYWKRRAWKKLYRRMHMDNNLAPKE
ncbi:MAG: DUF2061 domain-containing protein [Bacteroidales bacterium]|nr:DUF2061 domain-containing protein [Bacteroidales bacterium]